MQVYIINQQQDWAAVDESNKFLSDFQNPSPGSTDYYNFGAEMRTKRRI